MTAPACTCLPLNRRLMAHLLKVDEGSVHEQGCVENAVTAALDALAAKVAGMEEPPRRSGPGLYLDGWRDGLGAVLAAIEKARPLAPGPPWL